MSLLAIGVNHNKTPLPLRERLNFAPEALPEALDSLASQSGVREAAIFSTCNRTELYCELKSASEQGVIAWLSDYRQVEDVKLRPCLYSHFGQDAVRHLMRVASGLDSMVLGEPQVLGQLKSSYQAAVQAGTVGTLLNQLFQHCFAAAKQVRSHTSLGHNPISVAVIAVQLAQQIFSDLTEHSALLIGAGDTIRLVAEHLRGNGLNRIMIANRTLEKAQALANRWQGSAISLEALPRHLAEADIIVSSTGSREPVLSRKLLESGLAQRKHRPVFLIDLAVPRDIDPDAAALEDVYLYTIDDLRSIIDHNRISRKKAAQEAETLIEELSLDFMGWLRLRSAVPAIRTLRGSVWEMRRAVLAEAEQKLRTGNAPGKVLADATRTLCRRFLHLPTVSLRDLARHTGSEEPVSSQEFPEEVSPPAKKR